MRNVFLQNFGLGRLGVAEIHHLIEELVDNNKVVANGLFFELFEVLSKDFDDFVEEEEDLGSIGVALGQCEKVKI